MSRVDTSDTHSPNVALPTGLQEPEELVVVGRNDDKLAAHKSVAIATSAVPPVLAVEGVTFAYPDGTVALRDLSLTLPQGRRIALLGANGCGKTTLFLHFNGILQPSAGTVSHNGDLIRYNRDALRELRRRVGLVFQDPDSQLFAASVRQDVSFGPLNLGWSEEHVRAMVEQVIADTNLVELAERPTHMLSYGQKEAGCDCRCARDGAGGRYC